MTQPPMTQIVPRAHWIVNEILAILRDFHAQIACTEDDGVHRTARLLAGMTKISFSIFTVCRQRVT